MPTDSRSKRSLPAARFRSAACRAAPTSASPGPAALREASAAALAARRRRIGRIRGIRSCQARALGVTVNGVPLPDTDIVSILRNWTAGDLGSIAASLGVVVHFLATHSGLQAALRTDRSGLAPAIEEMLRIDDSFLANRRVTTRPARIAGVELAPGTRVYRNWTSANRDEAVFADPDAYRPEENAPHNLVYGTGIYVCPGRPLATMELAAVVETLLRATGAIDLADDVEAVRETSPLGGWRRVPVRLR